MKNQLYENLYEIIFNKSNLSILLLKNQLKNLLIHFINSNSNKIITNISHTNYQNLQQDFIKNIDNQIDINNNFIFLNKFPLYDANLFIHQLFIDNYINLKNYENINLYNDHYLDETSLLLDELDIIEQIDIDSKNKNVSITLKYLPNDNINTLNQDLNNLINQLNELNEKNEENEKVKNINTEIDTKKKLIQFQNDRILSLKNNYLSLLKDELNNEIDYIKTTLLLQLIQINHNLISSKDTLILLKETDKYKLQLNKIELDYNYLKKISKIINQYLNDKSNTIAFIKSKIFKYFKFLKELEFNIFNFKSKLFKSIQLYNELLTRQNSVIQKINQLINDIDSIYNKFDTIISQSLQTNLKNIINSLNNLIINLKNNNYDIEQLEYYYIINRNQFDQEILNIKNFLKKNNKSHLKKYLINQNLKKKKFITDELTRLIQQNNLSNFNDNNIIHNILEDIISLNIQDDNININIIKLKQIHRLVLINHNDLQQYLLKKNELMNEKDTFLLNINESINLHNEKLSSFSNNNSIEYIKSKLDLNNKIEEKALLLQFYNKYLDYLNQIIESLKNTCSSQQQQINILLSNIKNKIESYSICQNSDLSNTQIIKDTLIESIPDINHSTFYKSKIIDNENLKSVIINHSIIYESSIPHDEKSNESISDSILIESSKPFSSIVSDSIIYESSIHPNKKTKKNNLNSSITFSIIQESIPTIQKSIKESTSEQIKESILNKSIKESTSEQIKESILNKSIPTIQKSIKESTSKHIKESILNKSNILKSEINKELLKKKLREDIINNTLTPDSFKEKLKKLES
jgi:hypothetical protein